MVKKKSPLEPSAGPRKRAYELPNMINVQGVSQDPLRQIEDQALRDLSNEYRTIRVEEMIQKKRRQLEKTVPGADSSMQKQNLDLVTSIFKLVKETQPQQSKDETLAYVTLFKDLMVESAKLQNQGGRGPSFFENVISDPNLYQRTKDIFGGGKIGDSNTSDVRIEELRGERMLQAKRLDLERDKMKLEIESKQQNLGMIGQIIAPFMAYGGAKMAEDMKLKGMDMAGRSRNPGNIAAIPGSLQGATAEMQIQCPCGFDKPMLVPDPPPSTINCPGCGTALNIEIPPSSDTDTEEPWRNQP